MSEISLSPVGREQIHKLETVLLVNSILRPEVLEEMRRTEERITWVDSLAVAAAALAREKAKMPITQIAEELGRTETTIRNHLQGKTRAGQIVKETYERIAMEGARILMPETISTQEITRLKTELEKEKRRRQEMENALEDIRKTLVDLLNRLKVI